MSAQLALYELQERRVSGPRSDRRELRQNPTPSAVLCASCQSKEARYGFQPDRNDPLIERPRTLCFECFRLELGRRQDAARDVQAVLPLGQTLETLGHRRRQAQIAARHALELR